MNSSHILHSQVSLSPKFHFYSTCPYFKGLAQSWVPNRHLIHNQLTGHLIPIYEHMFSITSWRMGTGDGACRISSGSQLRGVYKDAGKVGSPALCGP